MTKTLVKKPRTRKTKPPHAVYKSNKTRTRVKRGAKSEQIFKQIHNALKTKGRDLVQKTKGRYQFNITSPDAKWYLDLMHNKGKVTNEQNITTKHTEKANIIITVKDDDLDKIARGKLDPRYAFMVGKLEVKGDKKYAKKLKYVFKSCITKNPPKIPPISTQYQPN
jgi:putative sterol carrier protein